MIYQNIFNGNGYINFDISFFENFAAVNNYSIVHSCLIFNYPKNVYFSTPVRKDFFEVVDLNKLKDIAIFYLLKKEKNTDFKFPYQDRGSSWSENELYKINYSYQDEMPNKLYIPYEKEKKINLLQLVKNIIKKIINR